MLPAIDLAYTSVPMRILRRATVLLVDDSELTRRILAEILRKAGARVEEASTGAEAICLAMSLQPDVVVLDVVLPDIAGFEVARHLKEVEVTAAIPILHLSALRTSSDERAFGLDHGADAYLTQPVDAQVFLSTVGALVRMKRTTDRLMAHQAFTAAIAGADTPEDVAARVLDEGVWAAQADGAAVVTARDGVLSIVGASPGWQAVLGAGGERFSTETSGPLGVCVWTGEPAWIPSPEALADDYPQCAETTLGPCALACVPLVFEGGTKGAVAFWFAEPQRFTAAEKKLLTTLVGECALALERGHIRAAEQRALAERARVEEALRRSIHAREDLLAIVAHDLRNPLGTVVMGVSMIQSLLATAPSPEPARIRSMTERILRSGESMRVLVNDLLDAAALESGRFSLVREPHSIVAIGGEVVELFDSLAQEKALSLTSEVEGEAVALCDRKRVVQILSNLVSNAIKFTPAGGSIRIRVAPGEGEIVVAVADTGAGIPEDHLPHLFDRYWTGQRRDGAGAGLGLFIVRGLVDAHGGSVSVKSRAGEGTTFSFTLPSSERDPRRAG